MGIVTTFWRYEKQLNAYAQEAGSNPSYFRGDSAGLIDQITTLETVMTEAMTLRTIQDAVTGSAAAFRCRRRLQPAGGEGDKVFPPTFAGAVYAVEQRRVPGHTDPATCVLLDSVQSQANRMEVALQDAVDGGRLRLPLVEVDFSEHGPTDDVDADKSAGRLIDAVGKITSLQVPHRLADAILRDSELNGVPFRQSTVGKALNTVSLANATPLFELCPTALIFGMWDSTGPKGGLGPKFERAMVSEIVGIGAAPGIKTQSRIDPVISKTTGITLYQKIGGGWTLREEEAVREKGKAVKLGKDGKASEANLGNVTPAFHKYGKGAEGLDPLTGEQAREGRIAPGGVTVEYAEQTTTLSLICLRRLRFPLDGKADLAADHAARTVLAALGLCSATLAFEGGVGLRSRSLLWPDAPMSWQLLERPGTPPREFQLTADQAIALLNEAIGAARERGLAWSEKPVMLKPSTELLKLVRLSQAEATKEGTDGSP
jgi:CRISPR-associated protein Csb1